VNLTAERAPARFRSWVIQYSIFAAFLVSSHFWILNLPYFWDEAGQFIPAALDIWRAGAWVPRSTVPNIHPPAVPAYLAAVWQIAGYSPVATRTAMLALSAFGSLAAFLLAGELCQGRTGPPRLAAFLVLVSPVCFAQGMMAQLDAPAMAFSSLALLLFLKKRVRLAALACIGLVLVKETGLITALVLGAWLLWERRPRDSAWYLVPGLVLTAWIGLLAWRTGYWAGNTEFVQYNLWDTLEPARLAATLARRVYYLTIANFHWIGTIAILLAWRRTRLFRTRGWAVSAVIVCAHIALFSVTGGAVLNRYLLPVLPIVYAAAADALWAIASVPRMVATVALVAGLTASNFINPPYPFPFEENLAFVDFVELHRDAAGYIARHFADPVVKTAWPMSAELTRPEFGFSPRTMRVEPIPDFSAGTLAKLDWSASQIVVVFSRKWEPQKSLLPAKLAGAWEGLYDYVQDATLAESRAQARFPIEATFIRRGQWVEIYANPKLRRNF
jgi:hypothetical protein